MELTWLDRDHLDTGDVAGAVAVLEAARVVDSPHRLSPTVSWFTGIIRHGWDADPPLTAVGRDPRGRVNALLQVWLPHWDNTHLGAVEVTVDPEARRRGLGRRLFEAGVDRVCTAGRRLVLSVCFDGSAGVGFLKAMGLDPALEEVYRRLNLLSLDWAQLDHAYATAEGYAGGYELVQMPGRSPEDMIADIVAMTGAINDAPTGSLDIEDDVLSPERVCAYEDAQLARGYRLYRLVARERDTGVLAGHTVVAVDGERPWHAWQHDTSVVAAHRGRRLGLLLKIAMLRWLRQEEPQLRTVDTGNAASNAHMIRVNEILGHQVVAKSIECQRQL